MSRQQHESIGHSYHAIARNDRSRPFVSRNTRFGTDQAKLS
jgi:hypothetical protein